MFTAFYVWPWSARASCYTCEVMKRILAFQLGVLATITLLGCPTVPHSAPPRPVDVHVAAGTNLDTVEVNDGQVIELAPGHYEGHLRIDADDALIVGAGTEQTTIEGNLSIKGDSNTVREMTIIGHILISGDNNRVTPVDSRDANKIVRGTGNRY